MMQQAGVTLLVLTVGTFSSPLEGGLLIDSTTSSLHAWSDSDMCAPQHAWSDSDVCAPQHAWSDSDVCAPQHA
jgi:hypothetical protein